MEIGFLDNGTVRGWNRVIFADKEAHLCIKGIRFDTLKTAQTKIGYCSVSLWMFENNLNLLF